ncbi:MAG TPA: hypothetical protein VK905_04705 [Bacillota bacterium]|nr:hypothetical protein [Bacillota bacterium]
MRRSLPLTITSFVGFWIVFDYFVKIDFVRTWTTNFTNWVIIVAAFALGLGAVNLLRIHGKRVAERRPGWMESSVLLVALAYMTVTGIFLGTSSESFLFAFTNLQQPLSAAMFSLLVFFIASASFRAFRARSIEAAVLLIAGVILMLGRAPIGEAIWDQFPRMADWIMKVPNLAGNRGIMIGAAIGIVSVAMRVLLGIDRGYMGQE